MELAFTICSKNYLAQAKVLCQSYKATHRGNKFIIALADKLLPQEKLALKDYDILEMDELTDKAITAMVNRYNIIELNTALKPFFIRHLFQFNASLEKLIYLDPDIYVFGNMDIVFKDLDTYDFILTPHFSTPIYDSFLLTEKIVLNTGIFNLGFIAVKRSHTLTDLLKWWCMKMTNECIHNLAKGYFVDQLWMNLSICHFNNYKIDKSPGLNAAHWNLHERTFKCQNNIWWVNDTYPLLFFHFSSYNPLHPQQIANWQNRYSFSSRPDIQPLFLFYKNVLMANHYNYYSSLKPYYGIKVHQKLKTSFIIKLKNYLVKAWYHES